MKHLEVRQKYSAARRIFNCLLGISSGDETLRLMLDILLVVKHLNQKLYGNNFCFEKFIPTENYVLLSGRHML